LSSFFGLFQNQSVNVILDPGVHFGAQVLVHDLVHPVTVFSPFLLHTNQAAHRDFDLTTSLGFACDRGSAGFNRKNGPDLKETVQGAALRTPIMHRGGTFESHLSPDGNKASELNRRAIEWSYDWLWSCGNLSNNRLTKV